MSIHFFGIRHHGPGCARSLKQALEQLQPDAILIEGPPEADDLLALTASEAMRPPVALLIYAPNAPRHAAYYPFAEFSPEWQAIQYGQSAAVPTRFMDLPQSIQIAQEIAVEEAAKEAAKAASEKNADDTELESSEAEPSEQTPEPDAASRSSFSADALAWLAEAAGYSDSDTWWEHLVEQRQDSLDLFAAIEEMMTVARQELGETLSPREALREAHMRQTIRAAEKEGHQRIAVVCGAWHVPALRTMPSAKSDNDLLKGLPKIKLAATWTPWSYGRLTYTSGYGAGVRAPGWYRHLWQTPERAGLYWLTDAAALLRKHDLGASSAHVIEAWRLAESLASLRERPRAGLGELLEAMQSVMFGDTDAPMRVIERELLVRDGLGSVPPETPMLPLQLDVKQLQKRYRMAVRADHTSLELDIRQETHLEKSIFLHRLNLMDIPWGRKQHVSGKSGSFHENWTLQWEPEFELKLIEANVWGASLEAACHGKICNQAQNATQLPELTALAEHVLQADVRSAIPAVMQAMQAQAAATNDAAMLLAALPPLANVLRYGSSRKTDTSSVALVMDGLVARACIALPIAAQGINSDAAQELLKHVVAADKALHLLQKAEYLEQWFAALQTCAARTGLHSLIAGRAVRFLTEQNIWTLEQAAQALSLACTHPVDPTASAEWMAGFLSGSGLLLVTNDALWTILDDWVASLSDEAFMELLPLMRRTFSTFEGPERRQLGERVAHGATLLTRPTSAASECNHERAALLLPVLQQILAPLSAPINAPTSAPQPSDAA